MTPTLRFWHPRDKTCLGIVLAIFTLSRILYFAAGVRFDTTPLTWYMQFLDPLVLRTDLLRGLVVLHSQPPLFNAFLGVVLKCFPVSYGAAFHSLFIAAGLLLNVFLYALMRQLGVRPSVACALTSVFLVSPPAIIYENVLHYPYALALALCGTAALLPYATRGWRSRMAYFSLVAAICLLHSIFHPVWFILCYAVFVLGMRVRARNAAVSATLPLLAVIAWYAKNLLVFGFFGASSWMGLNLSSVTVAALPRADVERLVRDGQLSSLALVPPWEEPRAYRPYASVPTYGVAAVDDALKSTGAVNFNNAIYVPIGKAYLRDSLRAIFVRPGAYLALVRSSWALYCRPADEIDYLADNRTYIRSVERAFETVVYLRPVGALMTSWAPVQHLFRSSLAYGITLPFVTAACMLWAAGALGRLLTGRAAGNYAAMKSMMAVHIVWVGVVANLFEHNENNRMRFSVEPLLVVVCALAVERILARICDAKRRESFMTLPGNR